MKILICLMVLMLGFGSPLAAIPFDLAAERDASNGRWAITEIFLMQSGGACLNTPPFADLAGGAFGAGSGRQCNARYFNLLNDLPEEFRLASTDIFIEERLAFFKIESVLEGESGQAAWARFSRFASGDWLIWTDMSHMFTLLDGNDLAVDFGCQIEPANNLGVDPAKSTADGSAATRLPQSSPLVLLGAGLIGLVVCGKSRH